jgi:very-short-patch-repair endonuclease
MSFKMRGRKQSESTKEKLSEISKKRWLDEGFRAIRSRASKAMWQRDGFAKRQSDIRLGKSPSEKTKQKMRLSALKYIEEMGGAVRAKVGRAEKSILDQQEIDNKCKIMRSYHIKELGYIVDGYDKENNVVFEVYEPYHNRESQKRRDSIRQKQIQDYLGCGFFIVYAPSSRSRSNMVIR